MSIYRGFSTINRIRKFRVTDFDLIKQDIFNHFNIKKGEKLMNPEFGTIIWNLLFEPFTDETKQAIVDDVTRIVDYDPRVTLNAIVINSYDHGINLQLDLTYLTENQTDTIRLQFDNRKTSIMAA
jgi:phage baseplate assembly protein W